MKKILFFISISFFMCATQDSNFYAIKISITHQSEYNQTTWNKILDQLYWLIEQTKENEKDTSAEHFSNDLTSVAETIKNIDALTKDDSSCQLIITTMDSEELLVKGEQEIVVSFKVSQDSNIDNKNQITQLITNFSEQCNKNHSLAIDNFDNTVQAVFFLLSGEARIIINS